ATVSNAFSFLDPASGCGVTCRVIPRYDAVSRNTGKIVGIGNTRNSFQRLPFSGPRIEVRGDGKP
ncbi:MAG TPA: hypothetical protein H9939_08435, partial [Candidatus Barnesiella merdigallinarum]|nr:hypothetical protein [Candidatus Barnesiella merdigallinarum]